MEVHIEKQKNIKKCATILIEGLICIILVYFIMPFAFITPKIKDWSQAYEVLSNIPIVIILKFLSTFITAYGIISLVYSFLIKEKRGCNENGRSL